MTLFKQMLSFPVTSTSSKLLNVFSLLCFVTLCPLQSASSFTMGPSFSAIDLRQGFYSGVEVGDSTTDFGTGIADARIPAGDPTNGNTGDETITDSAARAIVDNDGYSMRVFMGWMFHPNFGIELGAFTMSNINVKCIDYDEMRASMFSQCSDYPSGSQLEKIKLNLFVVDLSPKLVLPITDQFRFFTQDDNITTDIETKSIGVIYRAV